MAEIVAVTGRLVLRVVAPGDVEEWLEHMNTPEVTAFLGGPQSEEKVAQSFARMREAGEAGAPAFYIVALKETGATIGRCGLATIDTPEAPTALRGQLQIGWTLRADHWGKGYASEAARSALALAFERHGAPIVYAQTSERNAASWRVMERLGMQRLAHCDYHDPAYPPEDNPTMVYAIAQREWRNRQNEASR